MANDFCNLHCHTHSSLIDGLGRPDTMVARAKKLGQPAIAVTDHGTLAGVPEMYREAKSQGVQLIVGVEAYIVPDTTITGFGEQGNLRDGRNFHLTLLAKNEQGYKELVKLVSWSQQRENTYHKPRISHEMLRMVDTDHLVCLSGCVMGELAETLLDHLWALQPKNATKYDQWRHPHHIDKSNKHVKAGVNAARDVMKFYRSLFPEGQYFYEFMYHQFAPEAWVHQLLVPEAQRYSIPIVATNDSHYVVESQAEAHDLLMSIQWKQEFCGIKDPKRLDIVSAKKLQQRMDELLPKGTIRQGIANTLEIADLCAGFKITPLESKKTHMPKAREADGTVIDKPIRRIKDLSSGRLSRLCERYPERSSEYVARFDRELGVIKKLRYQHYFLATAGIIRRAKDKGIIVGAGRGSGAGSLVAFCLGITDVDPIRHRLLFERFLNPAKKSLPDFDTDIESDRIEEVFKDIVDVYGDDNVRRVCTYQRYAPKALMTDLLKTLPTRMSHDEIKEITKELPDDTRDREDDAFMETWWRELRELTSAPEDEKDAADTIALRKLIDKSKRFPIEEYSHQFYGIRKAVSTHAAGVVITSDGGYRISDWVPDQLITSTGKNVTQYDMEDVAKMGFVKFDILSLGTLSQIAECHRLIGGNPLDEFDLQNDKKTYDMISECHTDGVFQLTGYAAKQTIKQIGGCRDFEDIVAVTALCRPGASKFTNAYREGRSNPDKVRYADDDDRDILGISYGVILYQEQVMSLGWSIGMTDEEVSGDISLLSAIKKYSKTIMDQVEPIFREKAMLKGWSPDFIDLRWSNIEDYVGYGFNRNHAVAYSITSYHTAYLKANYPSAFITSRLSQCESMSDKDKKKKLMQALVQDARRMGIKVLPPDINKSGVTFTINKNRIRWGLSNVKGIGVMAAREMIKHRPYIREDWRDNDRGPRGGVIKPYLNKVTVSVCNAGAVGALIKVGGFPGIDPGADRFSNEFELLGCNVTEHTNKKVLAQIKDRVGDADNLKTLRKRKPNDVECVVGGVVYNVKEITTKKGHRMAFITLALGPMEFDVTCFQEVWSGVDRRGREVGKGVRKKVKRGKLLFVQATATYDVDRGKSVIANKIQTFK